ncbi:MAG: chorismate-binding protein, partial [Candidatus Margulisiibacteriota bacterium]
MTNVKFQIKENYLTPLSVFETLYNGSGSFLLESPNGHGKLEQYSFIGINPIQTITDFETLRKTDLKHGAFGFFSYDFAWEIENLPNLAKDDLQLPKLMFVIPETLVVFDHLRGEIEVFSEDINKTLTRLRIVPPPSPSGRGGTVLQWRGEGTNIPSNLSKQQFENIVIKAKEYIKAGDIYQANLSQRFETKLKDHPFEVYKRLRKI